MLILYSIQYIYWAPTCNYVTLRTLHSVIVCILQALILIASVVRSRQDCVTTFSLHTNRHVGSRAGIGQPAHVNRLNINTGCTRNVNIIIRPNSTDTTTVRKKWVRFNKGHGFKQTSATVVLDLTTTSC